MNCRECQRDMSQCLDGRLPSGRRTAVIQHLETCEECNQLWGEFQQAQELVLRLPVRQVSPEFHQRLWERIKAGEGTREAVFNEPMPLLTKARYVFVGAAAAALMLVMLNGWSPGREPDSLGDLTQLVTQLPPATTVFEPKPFVPATFAVETAMSVARNYRNLNLGVRTLEQLPQGRLDESILRIICDNAGAVKNGTRILLWLQRDQHVELPTDMTVTLNLLEANLDVDKLRSTGGAHELHTILSPVIRRLTSLEPLVRQMKVRVIYRPDEQIEFERSASELFRRDGELLNFVDIQESGRSPRFPTFELRVSDRERGFTPGGSRKLLFIIKAPPSLK